MGFRSFVTLSAVLLFAGCGLINRMTAKSVRGPGHPGQPAEETESAGKDEIVAPFAAGKATVTVYATPGVIPAGSVAMSTAADFDTTSAEGDLGIPGPIELVSDNVMLSSSVPLTDTQISQILVSVETTEQQALALTAGENYVILFHVTKADGTYEVGVIPYGKLFRSGRKVQFYAVGLGTYQLAKTSTRIEQPTAKKSTSKPGSGKNAVAQETKAVAETPSESTENHADGTADGGSGPDPFIDGFANVAIRRNTSFSISTNIGNLSASAVLTVGSEDQSVLPDNGLTLARNGDTITVSGAPIKNATGTALVKVNAAENGKVAFQSFSVTVTPRGWSSVSEQLSPSGANMGTDSCGEAGLITAALGKGEAISIWTGNATPDVPIYRATFSAGMWSKPTSLTDIAAPGKYDYTTFGGSAVAQNGDAVLAWRRGNGTNDQVYIAERRGGTWTFPSNLSGSISPTGTNVHKVVVTGNKHGDVVIAWVQIHSGFRRIYKSEYRNGAWVHPSGLTDAISPAGTQAAYEELTAAMNDDGTTLIAWPQSDGTENRIYKSEYRAGTWTHPSSLSDAISPDIGSSNAARPSAAIDNNGSAIIAWHQNDGIPNVIMKSEYRNGSWSHPASILAAISDNSTSSVNPSVAMSEAGNAIIAWYQENSSTIRQLVVREYISGMWSAVPDPDTDALSASTGSGGYLPPSIGLDRAGNAGLVYEEVDGSIKRILRRKDYGEAWQTGSVLTSSGYGYDPSPLSVHPDGDISVIWLDGTSPEKVYGMVFH